MRTRNPELDEIAARGIVFDQALDFLPRHERTVNDHIEFGELDGQRALMALDEVMAQDATTYNQQPLVTSPNAGVLAMLTTMIDPKLIQVLLQPLKAEEVYGVIKKGDWVTDTIAFSMMEFTGETAAYGDFNESGRSDVNANWPQRQNFLWQTITEWGERELERMALAKIDLAAQKNLSSANTINRMANLVAFYGVSGLQNYGGLNDPSLSAALTPATKAAGGTSWKNALPTEILADIQAGYTQLVTQTGSNVDLEMPMTLGMHSISQNYFANTNSFGLTARGMVKEVFPNLKVVTAPQYLSGTTYSYQLIVDEMDGQRTCESAFSEKMRAHRIVPSMSSYRQKKTAGAWGTIIYRPIGITTMAGI
jgi:hypothetical protein